MFRALQSVTMQHSTSAPSADVHHAREAWSLPPELLAPAPRSITVARKALTKERLALVTDVLYLLVLPSVAWIVSSRGFQASASTSGAIAGGIAIGALMWLVADFRALRRAERLLREGIATKGRVVRSMGLALEAVFCDESGAPVQALFARGLAHAKGEGFAVLYFRDEDAIVAYLGDRLVTGVKRRAPIMSPALEGE
jgi:hypothetical protein